MRSSGVSGDFSPGVPGGSGFLFGMLGRLGSFTGVLGRLGSFAESLEGSGFFSWSRMTIPNWTPRAVGGLSGGRPRGAIGQIRLQIRS